MAAKTQPNNGGSHQTRIEQAELKAAAKHIGYCLGIREKRQDKEKCVQHNSPFLNSPAWQLR